MDVEEKDSASLPGLRPEEKTFIKVCTGDHALGVWRMRILFHGLTSRILTGLWGAGLLGSPAKPAWE